MSPNTRLCFDWWRGSFYQRTCSQPPVATPAVTPGLKGYNCTLRSCGSSGRAGDKGDWGTRRVMKADSKEKEDRQEDFFSSTFLLLLFFKTSKWSGKWGTISNSYTWLNFLKHNFTLKQLEGFKTSCLTFRLSFPSSEFQAREEYRTWHVWRLLNLHSHL